MPELAISLATRCRDSGRSDERDCRRRHVLMGARLARLLPAKRLHRIVVAVGPVLSIHYFRQYYGGGA